LPRPSSRVLTGRPKARRHVTGGNEPRSDARIGKLARILRGGGPGELVDDDSAALSDRRRIRDTREGVLAFGQIADPRRFRTSREGREDAVPEVRGSAAYAIG
jgi:hypothetical protein